MFVVVAATNATNLTDGIDGLCGTVSFIVALFFLVAAGITGYFAQGLTAAAMAGALAGFLLWNLHPAKVFMGDTGSLFIGGVLCALAFGINQPLLLIPAGIVYILETLSRHLAGGLFQADPRQAAFQNGSPPSSFRDVRLERKQDRGGLFSAGAGGLSGSVAAAVNPGGSCIFPGDCRIL